MLKSIQFAEHPLNSEGVWCEILRRPAPGRPALFLDRDDTVIKDIGYCTEPMTLWLSPEPPK